MEIIPNPSKAHGLAFSVISKEDTWSIGYYLDGDMLVHVSRAITPAEAEDLAAALIEAARLAREGEG